MSPDTSSMIRLLFYFMILASCANPVSPTGGVRDTQAPILQSEKSTSNLQTLANIRTVDLKFDEWVVVSDFLKEVIISPPLQFTPSMNTKGKGIRFELDDREELKQNTTYVINFGKSIKDLNEGNFFENYSFVFSTGDQLDEQKISGKVTDAFTGEVPEEAIVILYDEIRDSVVYIDRPTYFSKVGKNGTFKFEYIREDTFLVFALIDLNRNYYFDGNGESLGFLGQQILTYDTSLQNVQILISKPTPPFRVKEFNDDDAGSILIASEGIDSTLTISFDPRPSRTLEKKYPDSIRFYFRPIDTSYTIYASTSYSIDTFFYKKRGENTLRPLNIKGHLTNRPTKVKPNGGIDITFNHPVMSVNESRWQPQIDSGNLAVDISLVSNDSITWTLYIDDKNQGNRSLKILPGGVIDIHGQSILDTLIIPYFFVSAEDLGQIEISISQLDSNESYLCELLFENRVIEKIYASNTSSALQKYSHLDPGKYMLRIIEDRNKNRKWDPGEYLLRQQPEPIMTHQIEELRPNWEVKADISWK